MFALSEQTIKIFQAMSYPEAYQQFKKELNAKGLTLENVADRMGWKWNKLEKKLTPSHDWQISFHELILICKHSGVLTLLYWAIAQTMESDSHREDVPGLTPKLALEIMAEREEAIAKLTRTLAAPGCASGYNAIDAQFIHDAAMQVMQKDLKLITHLEPLLAEPGGVRMAVRVEDAQAERLAVGKFERFRARMRRAFRVETGRGE